MYPYKKFSLNLVISFFIEEHPSKITILDHLMQNCPNVLRLRWRDIDTSYMPTPGWSENLCGFNSLQDLTFNYNFNGKSGADSDMPFYGITLPNLISLSLNSDNLEGLLVTATWNLPSLQRLELMAKSLPSENGIQDLLAKHGKRLKSLTLDNSTSSRASMWDLILLCGDQLEQLVFYASASHILPHFQVGNLIPEIASATVRKVILFIKGLSDWDTSTLGDGVCRGFICHPGINKLSFPSLGQLVFCGDGFREQASELEVNRSVHLERSLEVLESLRFFGVEVIDRNGCDVSLVQRVEPEVLEIMRFMRWRIFEYK